MEATECDVVIIGCGPVGATLANLLGARGLRVEVLERDVGVPQIPRATHVDEETLRGFQMTGLIDQLLPHSAPFGPLEVVDGRGELLLRQDIRDPSAAHGYAEPRFFHQPSFERVLREGLARYPHVRLRLGVAGAAIEQDEAGIQVTCGDGARVRASWLVGCDGGRSFTREALGVGMTMLAPPRRWLIVDADLKDPADARQLPENFRYVFDPARLTVMVPGLGRHRRWEFRLDDGSESAPSETEVRRWIQAAIDPDALAFARIATYVHRSLIADRWKVGRALLAGDAAHLMPPAAGQGMCSGIRDVVNLAWKLDLALKGRASAALLETYERERRAHLEAVVAGTVFLADRLEASGPISRWGRRQAVQLIDALPPLQAAMRRRMRPPPLHGGIAAPNDALAGQHLPQGGARGAAGALSTDDALGEGFSLVTGPKGPGGPAVEWAAKHSIRVIRLGMDAVETDDAIGGWMRQHALGFALVRPDRVVFGAGPLPDLARVQDAFAAALPGT